MSTTMAIDPGHDDFVQLGEGPAATVFGAVDEETGQGFALKVYRGRLDRRARADLDRELAALNSLRESVPILVADAVEETADGHCVLRMELCAQSLTEMVESFGPLSVSDALAMGEMLASALAAVHQAGIVHGGVVPGNVLFWASGEPVLADAGLTLRRALPYDTARVIEFLPPETLRDGTADERSDLYGLGAVLHYMIEGTSPHHGTPGEQEGERALRVLGSPVPALQRPDLPVGLDQLVSALLAKNADARPLDATTVATRLGAMLGPSAPAPVAAPRPRGEPILVFGPETKPRRDLARSGLMVAVLALLTVIAVVAVVLLVNSPAELGGPPAGTQAAGSTPPVSSVPPVQIDLADPVDRGSYVELSWRSNASLYFAVIITVDGRTLRPEYVESATSLRVPVEPVGKYCFRVQGSVATGLYESRSKSFREAVCDR
ncbi:MAG: serine/threonine-protein kinase [Kibdelosporangium sp.]